MTFSACVYLESLDAPPLVEEMVPHSQLKILSPLRSEKFSLKLHWILNLVTRALGLVKGLPELPPPWLTITFKVFTFTTCNGHGCSYSYTSSPLNTSKLLSTSACTPSGVCGLKFARNPALILLSELSLLVQRVFCFSHSLIWFWLRLDGRVGPVAEVTEITPFGSAVFTNCPNFSTCRVHWIHIYTQTLAR